MLWRVLLVIAIAASLLPAVAEAAPARKIVIVHKKKMPTLRSPRGVGFLPGYRTPEQLRRIEHRPRYWYNGNLYYFGRPGWYGGRWNGGSFGPCWTSTPIGLQWSCGR